MKVRAIFALDTDSVLVQRVGIMFEPKEASCFLVRTVACHFQLSGTSATQVKRTRSQCTQQFP